jgi:hypothetical protein
MSHRIDPFLQYFKTQAKKSRMVDTNKDKIVFKKGNDEFLKTSFKFVFTMYSKTYMGLFYKNLQEIFHSGIYGVFKRYSELNSSAMIVGVNAKLKHQSTVRPLGFHGKIESLFVLCFILKIISSIVFLSELYFNSINKKQKRCGKKKDGKKKIKYPFIV